MRTKLKLSFYIFSFLATTAESIPTIPRGISIYKYCFESCFPQQLNNYQLNTHSTPEYDRSLIRKVHHNQSQSLPLMLFPQNFQSFKVAGLTPSPQTWRTRGLPFVCPLPSDLKVQVSLPGVPQWHIPQGHGDTQASSTLEGEDPADRQGGQKFKQP